MAVLILLRERKKKGRKEGKGESESVPHINPYSPYTYPQNPNNNILPSITNRRYTTAQNSLLIVFIVLLFYYKRS